MIQGTIEQRLIVSEALDRKVRLAQRRLCHLERDEGLELTRSRPGGRHPGAIDVSWTRRLPSRSINGERV